jgi:hypothetical protein
MGEIKTTNNWNSYFEGFNDQDKDIYFTEEYVKLYESDTDKAECFVYNEKEHKFLFPYLKRRIVSLTSEYYDFETPYGYGGPLANTSSEAFLKNATKAFIEKMKELNIVSGFVRYHPLLNNYKFILDKEYLPIYDRKTVVMNLDLSEIDILNNQIHSKHRNEIRKAEKEGLLFKVDPSFENIKDFIEIYNQTMQSVGSDDYYFFKPDYYERIAKELGANVFLGLIYLENKIISAAIFFKYGVYGHYHLSGSLREFLKYCPNNYLLYKTALYMKENGVKQFHLGGGTDNSLENSLYRFKKRFSKNEREFYLGKFIFNKEKYADICKRWDEEHSGDKDKFKKYFLKYRYI